MGEEVVMKLILLLLAMLIVGILCREQIMTLVNPTKPGVNKRLDNFYKTAGE
jgi:hypothetical protein